MIYKGTEGTGLSTLRGGKHPAPNRKGKRISTGKEMGTGSNSTPETWKKAQGKWGKKTNNWDAKATPEKDQVKEGYTTREEGSGS